MSPRQISGTEFRRRFPDKVIANRRNARSRAVERQAQPTQELIITPDTPQLILPTRYTTDDLTDEELIDLYRRSRVQSTGVNVLHHPGESDDSASMDNRFFGSNVLAELVAQKMRNVFPDAMGEVRARPISELDRFSDGGSDIAGLPDGKIVDVKYVGGGKPSNVTQRVRNDLQRAVDQGKDPIVSHYQMRGGYIDNRELRDLETMLNRFHDKPQEFELRGHIAGKDMLQHGSMQVIPPLHEPRLAMARDYPHGDNQMLIDYLMRTM